MMGMDYLRLNRILGKRRPIAIPSALDVRLFRVIAWGAVVYLVSMWVGYILYDRYVAEIAHDLVFPIVIPIAVVLLVCWWTCDIAPGFARWSTLTLAFLTSALAIVLVFDVDFLNRVELGVLAGYLFIVGGEASRQLRIVRQRGAVTANDSHDGP